MSVGRRRKGGHGAEFHLDERWMTSYADMITVLMCLFIVLYAMSTVDSHKFDELKNSLASGFGVTKTSELTLSNGVPIPKSLLDKHGKGFSKSISQTAVNTPASQNAANEPDVKDLAAKLTAALAKAHVSANAQVTVSSRGVTVGLIGSSTYFGGNDATLQPEGYTVLGAIGPVLKAEQKTITIEGHADPHGTAGAYGSDWALAAARATTVLTYLVGSGDVAPTRITAISYGSAYPVAGATSEAARNRRVDIVVHEPTSTTSTSDADPSTTDSGTSTSAAGTTPTATASSWMSTSTTRALVLATGTASTTGN